MKRVFLMRNMRAAVGLKFPQRRRNFAPESCGTRRESMRRATGRALLTWSEQVRMQCDIIPGTRPATQLARSVMYSQWQSRGAQLSMYLGTWACATQILCDAAAEILHVGAPCCTICGALSTRELRSTGASSAPLLQPTFNFTERAAGLGL
jgi:hypothetical protein